MVSHQYINLAVGVIPPFQIQISLIQVALMSHRLWLLCDNESSTAFPSNLKVICFVASWRWQTTMSGVRWCPAMLLPQSRAQYGTSSPSSRKLLLRWICPPLLSSPTSPCKSVPHYPSLYDCCLKYFYITTVSLALFWMIVPHRKWWFLFKWQLRYPHPLHTEVGREILDFARRNNISLLKGEKLK